MTTRTESPPKVKKRGTAAAKSPTLDPWWKMISEGIAIEVAPIPDVVEIVEGIVGEQSKLVIGSGSKSFKTWLTIDLALCISAGIPFLGRFAVPEPRKVLYCNLE